MNHGLVVFRNVRLLLVAFSFVVMGFGSAAVMAQEQATRLTFPATYKIPVKQAHLADVSEFELADYSINIAHESDGQADMAYTLPETLLGYKHSLNLYMRDKRTETVNGVSQTVRDFVGRDANATCRGAWNKMSCEVKFWVTPDLVALETLLRQARDSRIADRLEVAREFGNDPIGFTVVE